MFVKLTPSVLNCHCTVGVGEPADAVVLQGHHRADGNGAADGLGADRGRDIDGEGGRGGRCSVRRRADRVGEDRPELFAAGRLSGGEGVRRRSSVLDGGEAPPAFGLICHCTVGGGSPAAAAVNVTGVVTATVWLIGWVMMVGANSTVKRSALVATWPTALVNTACT